MMRKDDWSRPKQPQSRMQSRKLPSKRESQSANAAFGCLQGAEGTYDVFLDVYAIGADLRRRATSDVSDRQRANVKLFKADGTELDLDGKLPLDAGSSSKSPVRVEGAPSSEFQAQVEARDLSQLGAQEVKDLEQSLPEQKLIDLERPIAESLSHIKKYTDEKDTLTTRVPPTCAIRCARGKKSTFLVELFKRLKRPQWPTALWVTFNGFTEVPKQVQESSFHWLCRTLAHAVALPSAKAALANGSCSCSEQVLAAYFSGQQDFVLLVDEMNFLLTGEDPEADERAAMFLKQHFLSATGLIWFSPRTSKLM